MGTIERRLAALGLVLPAPMTVPEGVELMFPFVRIVDDRALISGHGPLRPDGSLAPPRGRVGAEVSPAEATNSARLTALAMLASLKTALGELDRVRCWVRVFGMVNGAPGFDAYPAIVNGCSRVLIDVYGPERGAHARSAIGVAGLPFGIPVEIEAEVTITP